MKQTSVLVVDDLELTRRNLVKILSVSPFIEVVGTAVNGNDAIRKVMALSPDVITLDLEMPVMDGFTFLRWLMKNNPRPVLIISSNDSNQIVFKALDLGAVDFLVKPVPTDQDQVHVFRKLLISRIKKIARLSSDTIASRVNFFHETTNLKAHIVEKKGRIDCIVIGASTGGPPAIHYIIASLPSTFATSIVIVQHMPKGFTRPFAERLARMTKIPVQEAEHGSEIHESGITIAPGGYHLIPQQSGTATFCSIEPKHDQDRYVPSIDRFMVAAAEIYKSRIMGVLLTGMGNDGSLGFEAIKKAGGITIAESETSALVYGMPKAVIRNNLADYIVPLTEIPEKILALC
ncbi:chemotaxis-specific protein-glutamate methyltransferase CheB [bacterium]|nr:chemotaxis-specific protein-glutamate methyltransferase CheB [bacterium]